MGKVYVVTEPITYRDGAPVPQFDISPAMDYGEIVILTKHSMNMFASVPMVRYLRIQLASFCDDDVILPVGDPTVIATVAAIAADINEGRFRILKWDKRQRKYIDIQVDTWGKEID